MAFVVLGLALCLGVLLAAFDSSGGSPAHRLERLSAALIVAWAAVVAAGVIYTIRESLLG